MRVSRCKAAVIAVLMTGASVVMFGAGAEAQEPIEATAEANCILIGGYAIHVTVQDLTGTGGSIVGSFSYTAPDGAGAGALAFLPVALPASGSSNAMALIPGNSTSYSGGVTVDFGEFTSSFEFSGELPGDCLAPVVPTTSIDPTTTTTGVAALPDDTVATPRFTG